MKPKILNQPDPSENEKTNKKLIWQKHSGNPNEDFLETTSNSCVVSILGVTICLLMLAYIEVMIFSFLPTTVYRTSDNPLGITTMLTVISFIAAINLYLEGFQTGALYSYKERQILETISVISFITLVSLSVAYEIFLAVIRAKSSDNPSAQLESLFTTDFWKAILSPPFIVHFVFIVILISVCVILKTYRIPHGYIRESMIDGNLKDIALNLQFKEDLYAASLINEENELNFL